ncbi:MAG: trypsin-like peptidase domain-containing protein [Phycisphaeraceae bacterium]|nr:trypsin-like peptidase domain-containing protein [Phycisphaeraceae bacterium]
MTPSPRRTSRPRPWGWLSKRLLAALALFGGAAGLSTVGGCQPSSPAVPALDAAGSAKASPEVARARELEQSVIEVAARHRPATVCLIFEDQESRRRGTGSGVIVRHENGRALVLTCGHVTRDPDRLCSVVLPDGRHFNGRSVATAMSDGVDLGLVEFETNGATLPTVEISRRLPTVGEWIVVLGHPRGLWIDGDGEDSTDGEVREGDALPRWQVDSGAARRLSDSERLAASVRPPVVRAGTVWSEASSGGGFRFDAPLEAGDSGGPILDLDGRVVGIASRCGWKSFWNWASAVAMLDGDPSRLLEFSELEVETVSGPLGAGAGDARIPRRSRDAGDRLESLRPLGAAVGASVVAIEGEGGRRAFALAVRPDGTLVTKASEVGFIAPLSAIHNGSRLPATRIGYDPDADLLLLQAPGLETPVAARIAPGDPSPGALLANVGPDGVIISTGTLSLEGSRMEDADGRPFMGLGWRRDAGRVRVQTVVPGTPAARAGLQRDDVLIRFNGSPITSERELPQRIAALKVGDTITLEFERNGEERWVQMVLDRRHPSARVRDRANTRGNISRAIPHRTRVLKQDGSVEPEECGSAVVDLEGRLVGMNLARVDRTMTLVLPMDELERRVQQMLTQRPLDLPRLTQLELGGFAVTEAGRRLRFSTVDARFVGPRVLGQLIGNALTPDGSGTTVLADDRLRWDAIFNEPGTFEVRFHGAVRGPRVLRLSIGGAFFDAPVSQGRHARGVTLGTVTVDRPGRQSVILEWADGGGEEIPGSIDRIELIRSGESGQESTAMGRTLRSRPLTVAGTAGR